MQIQGLKALLLMGGEGKRFGSPLPKQFHHLAGRKIYLHTLDKLLFCKKFEQIILVCHDDWIETVQKETESFPTVLVISAGKTRQQSAYLGLLACGTETKYVVIHDAVRPFVTQEILRANIEMVIKTGAVDTCIPSSDTLIHTIDCERINQIPPRKEYFRGQTPQSFQYDLILKAHHHAQKSDIQNASDDCQLVLDLSHPIAIVPGSEQNIKITSELDLFLAEQLLRLQIPLFSSTAKTLTGKRYVITGGTGGIGNAICKILQREGAEAIPLARHSSPYFGDLRQEATVQSLFSQIGPIDGLINSLGILAVKPLSTLSADEIQEQIETNLTALIYCCKWAQIHKGGHIINIASSSYTRGRKDYAIYSATKAAVVNFTQGLAEERKEIHINVLVPQRTDTPMRRSNFPNDPHNSLLSPIEVAEATLHLLKQELTGIIITPTSCPPMNQSKSFNKALIPEELHKE